MRRRSDLNFVEIENLIVEFLRENRNSSIEEIAEALDMSYSSVRKALEGKSGSRAYTGLCENGYCKCIAGVNFKNGRLVWLYSIVD